jgi:hypothetical protein
MAGWELFSGASADQDDARVGLLAALAGRLNDAIMLMVARWRRGEGDELLSPLVMPALVLGAALATLLRASAEEVAVTIPAASLRRSWSRCDRLPRSSKARSRQSTGPLTKERADPLTSPENPADKRLRIDSPGGAWIASNVN